MPLAVAHLLHGDDIVSACAEARLQLINYAGVNICLIKVATHALSSALGCIYLCLGGG